MTTIVAPPSNASKWQMGFNPLNAELNPICHLLALLGSATIVVVSRLRVNSVFKGLNPEYITVSRILNPKIGAGV